MTLGLMLWQGGEDLFNICSLLIDLSRLSVEMAQGTDSAKIHLDEAGFR